MTAPSVADQLRPHAVLSLVIVVALALRLGSPSPGTLALGDHAFLAVWSRHVAEATSVSLSRDALAAARRGDVETLRMELRREDGNLVYAILYGLRAAVRVQNLLDVFVLGSWFRLVGFSTTAAEFFMILVSVGSVAALYGLAWVVWRDRRIAAMSALLMAFLPGAVTTARWVSWHLFGQLTFVLSLLAAVVAITAFMRYGKRWYLVAAGAVWGLSLYSNVLLPFLVPIVLIPAFMRVGDRAEETTAGPDGPPGPSSSGVEVGRVRAIALYAAGGLVVFLPAVVFLVLRWTSFLRAVSFYAAGYYGSGITFEKLRALWTALSAAATLPTIALALYGAWVAIRQRRHAAVIVAWLAAYVIFAATFGTSELTNRTVLVSLPAVALMAAAAVVHSWDAICRRLDVRIGRRVCVAGVTTLMLVIAMPTVAYLRSPTVRSEQWRAVEWVLGRARPGALIVTNLSLGTQVLAPSLRTYAVIDAASLVRYWQGGGPVQEYVNRRYPHASLPASQLYVLLSLSERPRLEEQPVLDAVMPGVPSGEPLQDVSPLAGLGPNVRIYWYERPE